MPEDEWEAVADTFTRDHYRSLHGRIRLHVIDRNLAQHLPSPPARIIDVGGGAGHQSIPLARRGYEVTIADPSPAMLERARVAVAQQVPAAAVRLERVQGEEVVAAFGESSFDVAMCHGVIMYVEDPGVLIENLCNVVVPDGIVSVVAKNRNSLAMRLGMTQEWAGALAAFEARREVNRLGFDTRADTLEELEMMFADSGAETLAWYGVRLFSEPWSGEFQGVPDDIETALEVELEASRRDPYRAVSRLIHVVGRRRRREVGA